MDPADEEIPSGGAEIGEDPPWNAWSPYEVSERLAGLTVPWCVVAGWALDVFRGEETREHEDLEIAVPVGRFGEIRSALDPGSCSTSWARVTAGSSMIPRST